MNIPCIKRKNLNLFATTADQRILLGDELFLKTHYPLEFRRYRGQNLIEKWHEEDVLKHLTEPQSANKGNRAFVIFGAAGSGKSEAIRWIETSVKVFQDDRQVFRISRTELDPVIILQKLLSTIGKSLEKDTLVNWDILKKKPVTLANSLVWNALSSFLDSDDLIIPISYKLRPLIENNLRNNFVNVHKKDDLVAKQIDLISLEELQKTIDECALSINVDYEKVRKHIVDRFEAEVLGGYSFIKTIQIVGMIIENNTGKRPVLLIDDLVQSMNIYASDLLDFFITFEEGNWDIVIGLTPAAFESTKRGRELLTRINYLDTFDDRLYKLWLTDELGNESYFLNESNSGAYIKKYLKEFKRLNGFECGKTCVNYNICKSLQWDDEDDITLVPLNKHLTKRLFKSLFKGKGQARHFVVTVGEYLRAVYDKNEVEFLEQRVKREKFISVMDLNLKVFLESYIPMDVYGTLDITKSLLKLFGIEDLEGLTVNIVELSNDTNISSILAQNQIANRTSPELVAIRDWLEGKVVNKELLKPFRLACSEIIREFALITDLRLPYTSRSQSTIRREQVVEGCRIPLEIEGIDNFSGVRIERLIGHQAITMLSLVRSKGLSSEIIINEIMSNKHIRRVIDGASKINASWIEKFESATHIKCDELAFLLYVFIVHISETKSCPIIIKNTYILNSLSEIPSDWSQSIRKLSIVEKEFAENFFKDMFLLRENFYDGFKLGFLINKYSSIASVLDNLANISVEQLTDDFKVRNGTARELLLGIINLAVQYHELISNKNFEEYCNKELKGIKVLSELDTLSLKKINKELLTIRQCYMDMGKLLLLPDLLDKTELNLLSKFNQVEQQFPNSILVVSKSHKTAIYQWLLDVRLFAKRIIEEYNFVNEYATKKIYSDQDPQRECGSETITLYNSDCIDDMDVIELLYFVKGYTNKTQIIFKDTSEFNKINALMSSIKYEKVVDFLYFISSIEGYISKDEYKYLNIDELKCVAEKYVSVITKSGEISNFKQNINVDLSLMHALLNSSNLCETQKKLCRIIIQKSRITQALLYPKLIGGVDDQTCTDLIKILQQILKGRKMKNYTELKRYIGQLQNIFLKGEELTNETRIIITKLLKGTNYCKLIKSLKPEVLSEISSKYPSLANVIECRISWKY